ncbi:hypothetical protein LXL04_035146 [Taraxacum kok-saghyz]
MSFEIGESVEVIGNEAGLEGSYFEGKVIDRSRGRRTTKYDTLIADDESPPPTMYARLTRGYIVDARHNEGWWVGKYVRMEGETYTVLFENEAPGNQHVIYPRAKIRFHREWKTLERGKWKYVKK